MRVNRPPGSRCFSGFDFSIYVFVWRTPVSAPTARYALLVEKHLSPLVQLMS
ncbi:hypothetical protein D3C80_570010 [compost metagenome]